MAIGASETSADRYRREVAERFDGPLPPLFKERLFVHLSRFCRVRSCITGHVGVLLGQGRPAGDAHAVPQTVEDVVALLRRPIPEGSALAAALDRLEATPTPAPLPEPQTSVEGDLFDALTVVFLWPAASERARAAVRRAIGDATLELLIAYLAFIRTAHYWAETHPELAHEPDAAATLRGHGELAALLLDTRDADLVHEEQRLRRALDDLERTHRISEERRTLALQAAEMGAWDYDLVADVCHFDARAQQMYNLPSDVLDHRPEGVAAVVHPDDVGPLFRAIQHASNPAGNGRYDIDYRIARGDGGYGWLRAWGKAEFEGEGTARRAVRIVGASRDVTLEREAEHQRERLHHELVASQERLAAELAAARQLQTISTTLVSEQEPEVRYQTNDIGGPR